MKVAKALSDAFADTGWGQGGDRVGNELLSVVGVVAKFGTPKSHEIPPEIVDYHHFLYENLGVLGMSPTRSNPFRRVGVAVSRFSVCQVCYRHIYRGAYETGSKFLV